ncbi:nitroreductase family protein [Latilactobacillus fuchuensis]|uniref:nitroreductase family protein n=1 Tax=Latilactobacillus fuchuensis TaxID=164393 RepID=UPI0020C7CFB1|nr:nitroreductase family protein [Latilactobacillus fuchuensis]MCP8857486.1 nitroreductase family protein [Latilactobacillus fuchuensis]
MSELINNDFSKIMFDRHSVRQFDPSIKIPRDELQTMIEQAATAPSACNLQSWHFVVIDTPEGKSKLKEAAMKFNYPQIDSSSAVIFLAGDTKSHEVYRDVWQKGYAAGKIDKAKLDTILNTFLPLYEKATPEFLTLDATIDCSMVGMQLLLIARAHGYEANPWSGFNFKTIIPTLGLDEKRFVPVMAISLGKPATDQPVLKTDRYNTPMLTEFR